MNEIRKETQRNISLGKYLQCVVMGKTKVFGFLGFVLGWFAFGLGFGAGGEGYTWGRKANNPFLLLTLPQLIEF